MNKRKILILVVVIVVLLVLYKRWQQFKDAHILAQQAENDILIESGQAPTQVTSPTVYNFITGGTSSGGGGSNSGNSEGANKAALIDALEAKHNFTFTSGQRQSLMTYEIAQLENFLTYTETEIAQFLGL